VSNVRQVCRKPGGVSAQTDYREHPSCLIPVAPVRMKVIRMAESAETGNIDLFWRHSGLNQLLVVDFCEIEVGGTVKSLRA